MRSRVAPWIALAFGALPACSRPADDTAAATVAPPGTAVEEAPADRFDGWRPPEPGWVADLRRRTDPLEDGWPSEYGAELAERTLGAWLFAALADGVTPTLAGEIVGADFQGTSALVPEAFETLYDDGFVRVREGLSLADEPLEGGLVEAVEGWRSAFSGFALERVECRAVAVTPQGKHGFETELVIQLLARDADGVGLQHDTCWSVAWRIQASGAVHAASVRLTAFREVRAPRLFDDVTADVFGADPAFAEDLLQGNESLQGRQDRLAGLTFLGMHGVAVGDIDGDGLEDLYVTQPGGQPNRLFLHQPDGSARAAGAETGVAFLDHSFGALMADLDGDGQRDIVSSLGPHVVVSWNDGSGGFEAFTPLPSRDAYNFYSLCAGDADGDGDLDLYGGRYMAGTYIQGDVPDQLPVPYHDARNGAANFFWRNEGQRRFSDATTEVGLDEDNTRFSLASIWADLDDDGDLDLYVANDFGRNNLFRNDGGHFVDVAGQSAADDMAAGMGVTCSDVDLDGDLDLVISNMFAPAGQRITGQPRFMAAHVDLREHYTRHARGNTILLNQGGLHFTDGTDSAHMAPGGWSWGAKFFDWNSDGFEDLYVPNGFISGPRDDDLEGFFWRRVVALSPSEPPANWTYFNSWDVMRRLTMDDGFSWNGHERNYAYLNLGGGRFVDLSAVSGADVQDDSRVAATLDWDGDGRVDLLLRNRTGPRLRLLRNVWPDAANFLEVELTGAGVNTDAVGARVVVEAAGRRMQRTVYAGDGYLGSSSPRLYFGLGKAAVVERIEVRWPDGTRTVHDDVAARERYHIDQASGELTLRTRAAPDEPALTHRPLAPEVELRTRFALAEPLPMGPLVLGPHGDLATLAGEGPLVLFLDPRLGDVGRARLAALGAEAERMRADGGRVLVLVADAARVEQARALAPFDAIVVDESTQTKLRLLLVEVLGPFESLPTPVVGLLAPGGDSGTRLVAVYCGELDVARLADDVALAAQGGDELHDALAGGRWFRRQPRSLAMLAQALRRLGHGALADSFDTLAASAAPARTQRAQGDDDAETAAESEDQPSPVGGQDGGDAGPL